LATTLSIRSPEHPARRVAFGVGVALALHLAVGLGLILAIQIPRLIEPPPVVVSLVPPFAAPASPRPARKAPPPRLAPEVAPRLARPVGPAQIPPLPIPAAPTDANARARLFAAPFVPQERVRVGLRTTTGCPDSDVLNLSPEEQEACRKRAHDLRAGAPVYAVGPSDPGKRARLDRQAARNEKEQRRREDPVGAGDTPFINCIGVGDGRIGCPLAPLN
jgi:hypothetical protein